MIRAASSGESAGEYVGARSDPRPALCLSGGGFRATLFHLGALRRLNELSVLSRIGSISSVSGGSILNGVLAAKWSTLSLEENGSFSNFEEQIAEPIRRFCSHDLRTSLILGERLNPRRWLNLLRSFFSISGNVLAEAYETLFEGALLEAVPRPTETAPRFIFCATSVNTGACWHFHAGPAGRMGDFYSGYFSTMGMKLSEAVGASSAFPLAFSAFELERSKLQQPSRIDPWGELRPSSGKRAEIATDTFLLTDGGVYDNLGVEPVWSNATTLLSSDGGRPFVSVGAVGQSLLQRLERVANISSEQVGAVRKRWLVDQLRTKQRLGAFWAINTNVGDYQIPLSGSYSSNSCDLISKIRTDLNSFTEGEMCCLENHGYSLVDAAIRSRSPHLLPDDIPSFSWPHSDWIDDSHVAVALKGSACRGVGRDFIKWLARRATSALGN